MSRPTRFSDCFRGLAGALALLALLFVTFGAPAMAQGKPLDAPRASGMIAERYDGYVMLRNPNAPQSIKNLVTQTNAKRRAYYEQQAKQQKAPVADIGKIYAQQIIKRAPKGTYFLQADGKWARR